LIFIIECCLISSLWAFGIFFCSLLVSLPVHEDKEDLVHFYLYYVRIGEHVLGI
jgi:hypothetical protein